VEPNPKAWFDDNRDMELFFAARRGRVRGMSEQHFDPERRADMVHPEKQQWIEGGGSDEIRRIMPDISPQEQSYVGEVTSEAYSDLISRLEEYTNLEADNMALPQIVSIFYQNFQYIQQIEATHKQELEQLALDVVLSLPEFKIVRDAKDSGLVRYELNLGDPNETIDTPRTQADVDGELAQAEAMNLDMANGFDEAELDEKRLKRRFANILIQGGSVLKLYLFQLVSDQLREIDPGLINKYGVAAVFSQIGYWVLGFGLEATAGGSPGGLTALKSEGGNYIIKAAGQCLPFLIHEIAKGTYEYISADPEMEQARKLDTLEQETEDMLVGPGTFKIIAGYIPGDKQHLLPLIQKKLIQLDRDEVREILRRSQVGHKIMAELVAVSEEEWEDYVQSGEGGVEEEEYGYE
jgi:hypothetical protein